VADVQLPETIELTLGEARDVLFALDRASELGEPGSDFHRAITSSIRILTGKMWPELGRLLDDDEE
jgi:hypothetical protein